jgi:hypothetical protein
MKNILLWIAMVVLTLPVAQASEISLDEKSDFTIFHSLRGGVQPVLFAYNNVNFALFPDGRLDFEAPNRRAVNRRANYRNTRFNSFRNNNIRYNRNGQLVKIGNTRVFYNRLGNVIQIGQLDVDYFNGMLYRVGGLEVQYNRRGRLIAARGHVLERFHYGRGHDCDTHDFGDWRSNNYQNQDDWDDGIFFKRNEDSPLKK